MRYNRLLLWTIIMALAQGVSAQSHRATPRRTNKTVAAHKVPHENKLYQSMLPATAKVMFIDSLVVSKYDFLKQVPISLESGTLSYASPSHAEHSALGMYENDFHDRRFLAVADTAGSKLCQQFFVGNQWDKVSPISEINADEFTHQNYPFICADGITLFFAAKGEKSLGGYDVFMTTFDNDDTKWYQPQNYGLPFNSTANDYLVAIDDIDSLGWLVTDRHQPEDSVCIYTFEPMKVRVDFSADNLTTDQLRQYADIHSIRQTWAFGNRDHAMRRLKAMKEHLIDTQKNDAPLFVINDHSAISSANELKSAQSKPFFVQLQELRNMQTATLQTLESKRMQYHNATAALKHSLKDEILDLEKQQLQQQKDIKMLEKKIRSIEAGE